MVAAEVVSVRHSIVCHLQNIPHILLQVAAAGVAVATVVAVAAVTVVVAADTAAAAAAAATTVVVAAAAAEVLFSVSLFRGCPSIPTRTEQARGDLTSATVRRELARPERLVRTRRARLLTRRPRFPHPRTPWSARRPPPGAGPAWSWPRARPRSAPVSPLACQDGGRILRAPCDPLAARLSRCHVDECRDIRRLVCQARPGLWIVCVPT